MPAVRRPSSKARIIEQLKIVIQNWVIKWDADACPQLPSPTGTVSTTVARAARQATGARVRARLP